MSNCNTNNHQQIFLSDASLIDLRAPSEFAQGAFPTATSIPLMDDEQRRLVGICYKSQGQQKAIELGHSLVQGACKEQRISQWKKFAQEHPNNGFFYCFRGGLRSKTSQEWLREAGIDYPMIEGGYKAMRRYLIDQTVLTCGAIDVAVITGLTGSAKTKVLNQLNNSIDLEALANHRGSSFGKNITPQPSQISFENNLAIHLIKHRAKHQACLYLEDESRLIGSRALPLVLKNKMDQSPLILIEESIDYRVEQIFEDYVVDMLKQFTQVEQQQSTDPYQVMDRNEMISRYENYLIESTNKIKKRLGGAGLKDMHQLIGQAIKLQKETGDISLHKGWIVYLLKNYYDSMYEFQLKKKQSRIEFRGDTQQVLSYIHNAGSRNL